jgi:hypothetical protein
VSAEREVYAWSNVTGWMTQLPLSEALRRRLNWAETPEALFPQELPDIRLPDDGRL